MSHPTPTSARKQIVEIIGNSVYQALGLKESLQDELAALEAQDMDALRAAVDNKSRCVAALHTLEQQRKDFCVSAGFESGPEQMDQLAEWCDEDAVLANCWQHVTDIAVECNAMNLTNGAIIRTRQQQIEAGLAVIRGGTQDPAVYGRSGRGPSGPSQRSLAEA